MTIFYGARDADMAAAPRPWLLLVKDAVTLARSESNKELAAEYGVAEGTIRSIKEGWRWARI